MSTPVHVERSQEDADDLYWFWTGEHLSPGAEVTVAPAEVAVFFDVDDDGRVLATVGPGRTALSADSHPALAPYLEKHLFSAPKPIGICFITTAEWSGWEVAVDCGDVVPAGDDADVIALSVSAELTVRIENVAQFFAALLTAELAADDDDDDGDDDSNDDDDDDDGDSDDDNDDALDAMVATALRGAVAAAILQPPVAITGMASAITTKAPAAMSPKLLELLGMSVSALSNLQLYRDGEPL